LPRRVISVQPRTFAAPANSALLSIPSFAKETYSVASLVYVIIEMTFWAPSPLHLFSDEVITSTDVLTMSYDLKMFGSHAVSIKANLFEMVEF
jgi:hypothetical protein